MAQVSETNSKTGQVALLPALPSGRADIEQTVPRASNRWSAAPDLEARERSLQEGVPLRPSTYQALVKYAKTAGLETELALVQGTRPVP